MTLSSASDYVLSQVQGPENEAIIYLAGDVSRRSIVAVRADLEMYVNQAKKGSVILLDMSDVTATDSATLSLWLCLLRAAKTVGCSISAVHVPEALLAGARVVGLAHMFEG